MSTEKNGRTETFGVRLRRLRKAKGFTQVELARAVGVSQPTIAYYENEDGFPGAVQIVKIAETLGLPPDEVLGMKAPGRRKEPESPENLRLWRKLRQVETLPPAERRQVIQFIEALVERMQLKRKAS